MVAKYLYGYDDKHIIAFRNTKNELIEAVEVTTVDTKYLVKESSKLAVSIENYDAYENYVSDDPNAARPYGSCRESSTEDELENYCAGIKFR